MKQTHISMHHAKLALDVYVQHELYALRTIQCEFIVAGNYDDMRRHEKHYHISKEHLRDQESFRMCVLLPPLCLIWATVITEWETWAAHSN